MEIFFLGKSKYRGNCFMDWNRLYQKNPLYYCVSTCVFHNICSRVFPFYDPTIGFGLDIVTSDIIGIVIAILITILFFVVMKNNKELPKSE
jgi:hypothetical protein